MHANYVLVKFDVYVQCKHDQDMNAGCTSPVNMSLGLLLVLFSTLQAALQTFHLPIQNLPFAAGLHQLPLKLHATHSSECQVFLSCRTPCGPRSFFRCTIIHNPYAYNSIATLAKHKTCNLSISCIITSKQSSSLPVATKDESEMSHGQTVSWTCPTCCLRAPAVDKLKMSKQV